MKPIKYCMFDFDGTLADSQKRWQTAHLRILQSCGFPVKEADFEASCVLSMADRWEYFIRNFGIVDADRPTHEEVLQDVDEFYRTALTWKEGAVEFLTWLRARGIKTALFSASPMSMLVHGIETLKAADYFDYIFSTSEIGAGKSDPKSYQFCLDAMGATAEESVMFEDAAYSMKTAKEAGLYVVAVYERWNATKDCYEARFLGNFRF